jgi:hypothetical protein
MESSQSQCAPGRSQETARKKAEDAAARKCNSNEYARFYNYIDALGTPGRYSAYFECSYIGDLTEWQRLALGPPSIAIDAVPLSAVFRPAASDLHNVNYRPRLCEKSASKCG